MCSSDLIEQSTFVPRFDAGDELSVEQAGQRGYRALRADRSVDSVIAVPVVRGGETERGGDGRFKGDDRTLVTQRSSNFG